MMKKFILFIIIVSLAGPQLLSAQVKINVSPGVFLTFPGEPSILDTLGQKVYDYSDETGYYACIVQNTSLNATTRSTLDVGRFYKEVYQSVIRPGDNCNTTKQTEVTLQDLLGMEFFATCDPDPEIPELRYKRLILYESRLFVLDFWTTQAYFSQSASKKNAFFESMNVQVNNAAPIPSAIEPSGSENKVSYKWLILILILVPVIYLIASRKPKK
jgi:hypothetical protein